jgi:hypothetical protein
VCPVPELDFGDASVRGKQPHQRILVQAREGSREASRIDGEASQAAPNPPRPRFLHGSMKAMKDLDLQACVLNLEGTDVEPTLLLGVADHIPSNEALGARGMIRCKCIYNF